jgi:hypothetical protein
MLDAIRAQVASLTDGQRIFMANHMYKHYGVYPTKLREYVPEDAPAPLKYKVGDVVVVRYDGDSVYSGMALNGLVAGDQGIITQVDPSDEMLPYELFIVDDYGTEVREWAAEDQLRKL